tara:strand:+ start:13310 stop:13726 length:417 start_codon:yes stop_codon:yes gene_type:complete
MHVYNRPIQIYLNEINGSLNILTTEGIINIINIQTDDYQKMSSRIINNSESIKLDILKDYNELIFFGILFNSYITINKPIVKIMHTNYALDFAYKISYINLCFHVKLFATKENIFNKLNEDSLNNICKFLIKDYLIYI